MEKKIAVIILAAGKGTRMKNPEMAKVMYEINGKPMVEHVVDLAIRLGSARVLVIVGWQKDSVTSSLKRTGKPVECIEQTPQLGTGHAVMQAEPALQGFEGDVLVLSGDVPLLKLETIRNLIRHHREEGARATVLTAEVDDPAGYGRIIRNDDGSVLSIVEQKDATDEQRNIREINSGIYVFDAACLFESLGHISPNNAQSEYYLTDVFEYFWRNKLRVSAVQAGNPQEIQGINTFAQLDAARAAMAEQ